MMSGWIANRKTSIPCETWLVLTNFVLKTPVGLNLYFPFDDINIDKCLWIYFAEHKQLHFRGFSYFNGVSSVGLVILLVKTDQKIIVVVVGDYPE